MYEKKLVIKNKIGLHARPATELTLLSQKFCSDIEIIDGTTTINPKSIISILSGGIHQGTEILLRVTGKDEQEAGKAIAKLIENFTD